MSVTWCVLRCRGRDTLRLPEKLNGQGFEAWTPREARKVRIPRANVRRETVLPMMPSYVFASADRLVDLIQLAPQHGFTLMRWDDRIPLIADEALRALRYLEARRAPKRKAARTFPAGVEVRVRMEGGSYAGMRGTVIRSNHGHSLLLIDRRMTVKIATSLLDADALEIAPLALRAV